MRAPVGQVLTHPGPVTDRWVQIGLAPSHGRPGALFGALSELVAEWRDRRLVDDFFFMNKPPGLRARFQPVPGQTAFVRAALRRLVRSWCTGGLVVDVAPGIYEPEEDRFGGPGPMAHAHRMFTVDAMTWLEFHARQRVTPAWALSLAMLRPVLDAMGVGREREQAIWARVAAAGRLLPPEVRASDTVTAGLASWWRGPGVLPEEETRGLAAVHAARVAPLAAAWATSLADDDFDDAVAWYVVFHWNRAALSFGRQALLTEALSKAPFESPSESPSGASLESPSESLPKALSAGGGDVR
jgi:thiopeptide-type bacteriocin biosynthesis protein